LSVTQNAHSSIQHLCAILINQCSKVSVLQNFTSEIRYYA
jgi:hypothetical protein